MSEKVSPLWRFTSGSGGNSIAARLHSLNCGEISAPIQVAPRRGGRVPVSPDRPVTGSGAGGGPRVSATQAALWGLAFAIIALLVVLYFVYGSAARPLLGAAGDMTGARAAWPLS